MKKCRQCNLKFEPFNSLQATCSVKCAVEWSKTPGAKKVVIKAKKAETRQMKAKFNATDRGYWTKKLDVVFNKFIRLRDRGLGCVSCAVTTGQMQCGHYKPKGSNGHLRWHEDNCHGQCATCNNHMSGNLGAYRERLIEKIGQDRVDWLEGPHEYKKYTIDEMKDLIDVYQKKVKQLEGL
jgi:5-methylcytosine-specific restriction endonuclease McrA